MAEEVKKGRKSRIASRPQICYSNPKGFSNKAVALLLSSPQLSFKTCFSVFAFVAFHPYSKPKFDSGLDDHQLSQWTKKYKNGKNFCFFSCSIENQKFISGVLRLVDDQNLTACAKQALFCTLFTTYQSIISYSWMDYYSCICNSQCVNPLVKSFRKSL